MGNGDRVGLRHISHTIVKVPRAFTQTALPDGVELPARNIVRLRSHGWNRNK